MLVGEQTARLTQKGCDGILNACKARGTQISVSPGQVVHVKCRSEFTNLRAIECHNKRKLSGEPEHQPKTRRSEESTFSYKDNCIFCGCPDAYKGKKPEHKLHPVRTTDFEKKILKACHEFKGEWADTVQGRIIFTHDLHAADAVYHDICNINFRTGKQVPRIFQRGTEQSTTKCRRVSVSAIGRPKDSLKSEAFKAVAEYLENNDDEQVTITDLLNKMEEYLRDTDVEPYSFPHMKSELKKHFKDRIIITEINGKQNVVTFHTTAAKILHNFHEQTSQKESDEKANIIEAAAKFIKQDIKNTTQTKDVYPSAEDLSPDKAIEFLPPSLHQLLLILFCGKNTTCKIASIGQAIMQAARPRVLQAPLQFGLGVQMHHLFQSKFLVDSLNRHGFACSYSEVKQFERSASVAQGTELPELSVNNFVQYAGDNVDHNLITLDGTGTFHGMGMIAMVTPGAKLPRKIPRVNVTAEDIAHVGHIDIHQFLSERDTFKTLCFQKLRNPNTKDPSADVDLLWESSLLLNIQRPQWSGLMQLVHKGDTPGASSIMFLPMIDMDPNDLSCIYSTLKFISAHARQHSSCPVITFDQPLWWKAHTMVESLPELQPAIIRLGAFHTEMSFLGSIGHLMSGTGLQELLEVVYAGNAVVHMLSGKSVSRAVRGHILVDAALNTMVTSSALGTQLPFSTDNSKPDADCEGGTQQPSALDAGNQMLLYFIANESLYENCNCLMLKLFNCLILAESFHPCFRIP